CQHTASCDRWGGQHLAECRGKAAQEFLPVADQRSEGLGERRDEQTRDQPGAREELPGGNDAQIEEHWGAPHLPPRPAHRRSALLMCCQMRSFNTPKRSPDVMAKVRGRGRSTTMSSTRRPGRALNTTTRSAR